LDLPWDEMPDTPGVPRDRDARPSLDEALELRLERTATVRECLLVPLKEEWEHPLYAERDLGAL
jgi:hypothetical protein